jgi:hypothetical protein
MHSTRDRHDNTNANFLVTHLEITYLETLGELFGWKSQKKPQHLHAYPNHPRVYLARAAQHATMVAIKE